MALNMLPNYSITDATVPSRPNSGFMQSASGAGLLVHRVNVSWKKLRRLSNQPDC